MLKGILLESKDPEKIKVNEITSKPLIVGKPQMDIEDAVELMFKRNIKNFPDKETPKRMKKAVDYFNRIISISYE